MSEILALPEKRSPVKAAAASALQVPAEAPTVQPPAADSRTSSDEIAQKIMRLTGNVRLVSRAAHSWHHCGINE
jgi:hypothetical protein